MVQGIKLPQCPEKADMEKASQSTAMQTQTDFSNMIQRSTVVSRVADANTDVPVNFNNRIDIPFARMDPDG